jgi:hypothetical protein
MKSTAVVLTSAPDAEALIKEARRRQRRRYAATGGRAGPPATLPRGTQLIAGTDAGLLLEPRFGEVSGPFWLWTPGTAPKALPYSSSAEGFAVSPRQWFRPIARASPAYSSFT